MNKTENPLGHRQALRLELNDCVTDIQAIQCADAGVLGDVESLGGEHAGDNRSVAFPGPDPHGDPVLRLRPGEPHQAFIGNWGIGVGGGSSLPDFYSLNLDHLFRRPLGRVGVFGRQGRCRDRQNQSKSKEHP